MGQVGSGQHSERTSGEKLDAMIWEADAATEKPLRQESVTGLTHAEGSCERRTARKPGGKRGHVLSSDQRKEHVSRQRWHARHGGTICTPVPWRLRQEEC